MGKILTDSIIPTLKAEIPSLPISTNDIADKAVTSNKIADYSITTTQLDSGIINTRTLYDGAVTAAKADVAGIMNSAGANGQLFGLGGEAISVSSSNLNDLQAKTGFYMGNNLTNSPEGANAVWWFVEQMVHNPNYILQRATKFGGPNVLYCRTKYNGTWSEWKRIMTSDTIGLTNDLTSSLEWWAGVTNWSTVPSHFEVQGKVAFIALRVNISTVTSISSGGMVTVAKLPTGYTFKYIQHIKVNALSSKKQLYAECTGTEIKIINNDESAVSTSGE